MPGSYWIKAVREKSHIRPSVSPHDDRHTWILFDQDTVILEINGSCWMQAQLMISTHRWGCTGYRYYLWETPLIHTHLGREILPYIFGRVHISAIFLIQHMWLWQHCSLTKFPGSHRIWVFCPDSLHLAVCVCKEKCKIECQPCFSLVWSTAQ